jgi:hypothetical protein
VFLHHLLAGMATPTCAAGKIENGNANAKEFADAVKVNGTLTQFRKPHRPIVFLHHLGLAVAVLATPTFAW